MTAAVGATSGWESEKGHAYLEDPKRLQFPPGCGTKSPRDYQEL